MTPTATLSNPRRACQWTPDMTVRALRLIADQREMRSDLGEIANRLSACAETLRELRKRVRARRQARRTAGAA